MELASNIYILWPIVVILTTGIFLFLSRRRSNHEGRILQVNPDAVFLALLIVFMFFAMTLPHREPFFKDRSSEIIYLCIGAYVASKLGKALGEESSPVA